jgi:lipopolysaccharide export LptBFGC system permease protein LptF
VRILDRYVLTTFLKNYLISFMVLIGLYIVLDMVFNFDELSEVQNRAVQAGQLPVFMILRGIGSYYFFQTFRIFVQLSGIIPVVAAAFTLIRLGRFNELTASLAAGVPLLRTAAPVIFATAILMALLVVDQELLIPTMIPKLTRKHDEVQQATSHAFPVKAMQDDKNGLLNVARYHPASDESPAWMEQVDVIEFDENFMPKSHITADKGEWDERHKQWRLTNGKEVSGLRPNDKKSSETPIEAYQSNITPDEIALFRSGEYVELLPTSRINQLLQRPKSYGTTDLLRVKHFRIAQPILNLVLLLLAVPCLMSREPGRIKQGLFLCIILCGSCLACVFLTYQIAGTPPPRLLNEWPAMMAAAPILLFCPVAVFLLDHIKT